MVHDINNDKFVEHNIFFESAWLLRIAYSLNTSRNFFIGDKNFNIDALSKKKTTQNSDAVYVTLHHHQ